MGWTRDEIYCVIYNSWAKLMEICASFRIQFFHDTCATSIDNLMKSSWFSSIFSSVKLIDVCFKEMKH